MATAGRVLMIPAGDWKTGSNYEMLDVVVHLGSSYVAKNDINNSTKAPPGDLTNWQILAQGYDVTNIVTKNKIVNNLLATDPTTVLSGPMGKQLKGEIDTVNSDLGLITLYSETMSVTSTSGYVDMPISDYNDYTAQGYKGYILLGYLFATNTISSAVSHVVASNGTVRINFDKATIGNNTFRASIWWRK